MDKSACKRAKALLVLTVLLLLFLTSCSHTQQETDVALLYSPTLKELMTSPLSLQMELSGTGSEYELLGLEKFDFASRGPSQGFMLGQAGTYPTEVDDTWIKGSHPGGQQYIDFYKTSPQTLPLRPYGRYEVSYDYKVLEASREGFETILFSSKGANRNDWVEQSIYFNEPKGSTGKASFNATLKQYDDYQLLMNLVSNGSLAVTNIQIKDMDSGLVVAYEDGKGTVHTHSPLLHSEGEFSIVPSSSEEGGFSLKTHGFAKLRTDAQIVRFPPDTNIILEFDYKVLENPKQEETLGWIRLYSGSKPHLERRAVIVPGYQVKEGHYCGGVKTGSTDDIYILEVAFNQEVSLEVSNLKLSKQIAVKENLAFDFEQAAYPRLGNYFTQYGDWVANDAGGTAQGPIPLMSLIELEEQLALSDIVVGLHPLYLFNDPALSVRLKAKNPNIILLPYTQTHYVNIPKEMRNVSENHLANAEETYVRNVSKKWFLTNTKGEVINDNEKWAQIPLNVSHFCAVDETGRKFLDFWADSVYDLNLKDGTWEGVYLDDMLTQGTNRIPGMFSKSRVNADYNRNQKRDETPLWITEMTAAATLTMLRNLREKVGWEELIITGQGFESAIAGYTNGAVLMNYNYAWYPDYDPKQFNEAQWGGFMNSYQAVKDLYRSPSAVILEGSSVFKDWDLPREKRDITDQDLAFHRLALGTALLTDCFYEFDVVDARSAPFIFDEMLVDQSGRSTTDAINKGWLGMPLSDSEHLVYNKQEVYHQTKPLVLGNRSTKYLELFEGSNKENEAGQFIIEFDWKNLTTHTSKPYISVDINNEWAENYDFGSALVSSGGKASFHTTVTPKKGIKYALNTWKVGSVELGNLTISTADCGVYRRDFEHGIVLVNASEEDKTISLSEIRGSRNRTNIRRIKGTWDTKTNTGMLVTDSLVLAAHDAIVLLAD